MSKTFSFSRVETHHNCPFLYKLRYVDKLEPLDDIRPTNALYIGTATHEIIEKRSIEAGKESYKSHYPELNSDHELEMYKLEKMGLIATSEIPEGEYERKLLHSDGFIGFIDELVKNDDGTYTLYDFKASSNVDRYKSSSQLLVYKYYFEKITGNKIKDMYYACIPKSTTVLTEKLTLDEAKIKVDEFYRDKHVVFLPVELDNQKVNFFFARKAMMDKSDKTGVYEKRYSTNCKWCEYRKYCYSNGLDVSELKTCKELEEISLFD